MMDEVDWEGEWIILLAFGLQLIYSIWLVVESWKGTHTEMEFSTIIFQFAIQYFYVWYFIQHGMLYSAIGIGILTFAAVVAYVLVSYRRRKRVHHYHHVEKKCNHAKYRHQNGSISLSPTKVHPASHPSYLAKQMEHQRLYTNHVAQKAIMDI